MAVSRKISQLNSLLSASLDTQVVGISAGSTVRVSLNTIKNVIDSNINTGTTDRLNSLEEFTSSISIPNIESLNTFTSSYLTDSASFTQRIIEATNEQSFEGLVSGSSQLTASFDERYTLSGSIQEIILPSDLISSSTQISNLGFISSSTSTDLSSLNIFTQSIDSRVDGLESWSSSLTNTFATDLEVSIVSSSVAATIGIVSQATGLVSTSSFNAYTSSQSILNNKFATTGSNIFIDNQTISGRVSASYFDGDARYLDNFSSTTNWNYNQEYTIKKTEQLTFSGDYILEDTYLVIEGGIPNSIGEWEERLSTHSGSIFQLSNNQFEIIGPNATGGASDGNLITRYFDTETTMSVRYEWDGRDIGDDWPFYDIQNQYPYEYGNTNMLQDTNATSESGTWIINIPAESWVSFGVWTNSSNEIAGNLQITLPYLFGEDVEYSTNKYFKKEGTIFIGGNLLVKDSTIVNNGKICVGGEVILIGNSQIEGTGTII